MTAPAGNYIYNPTDQDLWCTPLQMIIGAGVYYCGPGTSAISSGPVFQTTTNPPTTGMVVKTVTPTNGSPSTWIIPPALANCASQGLVRVNGGEEVTQ